MKVKQVKLVAIVSCVVFIIFLIGVIGWRVKVYNEAQAHLAEQSNQLEAVKKEIAMMKASIDQYEIEKKDFEQYLFDDQDIPAFLEGVSGFAKETKVNVVDMKTQRFEAIKIGSDIDGRSPLAKRIQEKREAESKGKTPQNTLTLAAMPINIEIEGTYKSFIDFLDKLQGFKQLLTISNLELASTQKYPILHAAFTLKIYSFKTLEDLGVQK